MATTTTMTDPVTGDKANIYADVPIQLSAQKIDSTLAGVSGALEEEKGKLSPQGKTLVEDTQALIETTRRTELLQKLFTFAKKVEGRAERESVPSGDLASVGRTLVDRVTGMASSLQVDAEDVAGYIRSELYNYVTSSDYRELVAEFSIIIKKIAEAVEEEALDKEPSKEKDVQARPRAHWSQPLSLPKNIGVDKPVETEKTLSPLHEVGGLDKPSEVGECIHKPVVSAQKPLGSGLAQQGQEPLHPLIGEKPQSREELETLGRLGVRDPETWKAKHKQLEDRAIDDIEERVQRFLSRLAQKKEYQSLVKDFFKYSDQVYELMEDVAEDIKETPESKQLRVLVDESLQLLSDFAGKQNVEKYRQDLKQLLTKIKEDEELKKWRQEFRAYILESLKNPQIDSDQGAEKMKNLIREGRGVLGKYRDPINVIYEDQNKIAQAIKDDPTLREFNQKLKNLGTHMMLNSKGEVDPTKFQESMIQISSLMANLFRNYLVRLPVTRFEIESEDYDVVMNDIKVKGTGFAPDSMELITNTHSTMSFSDKPSQTVLLITFKVSNICPSFEDFDYFFNKKSFPTFQDQGRATITCKGAGLSIEASVRIQAEGVNPPKAEFSKLHVELGDLGIQILQQTQHSVLTPLLAPLFSESVRYRIESIIWNQLRIRFDDALIQINDYFLSHPLQQWTQDVATSIQSKLPTM